MIMGITCVVATLLLSLAVLISDNWPLAEDTSMSDPVPLPAIDPVDPLDLAVNDWRDSLTVVVSAVGDKGLKAQQLSAAQQADQTSAAALVSARADRDAKKSALEALIDHLSADA